MDPVLRTLNVATMVILVVLIVLMRKWYKRQGAGLCIPAMTTMRQTG